MPDSALVDRVRESPNFRERGPGDEVRVVVVHGTWMADDATALARLCDPAAEVSCHYYITREAEVVQLVPEARVAWHAGASVWQGREGVNGFSLGIEIGNRGPFADTPGAGEEVGGAGVDWARAEAYRDGQYDVLIRLLWDIASRYPGVVIVGHDTIAPGRKSDPGRHFDWERLRAAGLEIGT